MPTAASGFGFSERASTMYPTPAISWTATPVPERRWRRAGPTVLILKPHATAVSTAGPVGERPIPEPECRPAPRVLADITGRGAIDETHV
jgi:hypothetical protein